MEEKYLQDAIDIKDIQDGKLNVINAPCGCGKTTFVEKKLYKEAWWGNLLLLIDSKSGLKAFKSRGTDFYEYDGEIILYHKGITAMTYATFAMLCIYKPDEWLWLDDAALIVCDELHQCIKWSKIEQPNNPINLHKVALQEIHKRINIGAKGVALSATPKTIYREYGEDAIDVPINAPLKHYKIGTKIEYNNIWNLVKTLPADKKGIIYVPHVTQMIDISNALAERDISSVCIWSLSRQMDKEQLDAVTNVTEYEKMPDDVQVLIINAAYETGLNIKSQVDYVVVNSSDEDTQIQVIGRVRHDIDTVYVLTQKATGVIYITKDMVSDWLDKPLTTEDKSTICAEINGRDARGRLLGWTNIKKSLKWSGFTVTDKRKFGGESYSIISQ